MSRILIPRGPCCSSKIVASTDFESYFKDIINDYIVTGFTIAAQCPNILAVDICTGRGRQCGLYVENSATCTLTCLAACDETFMYITLNRDVMCRPCNFTFTTNLTGCIPTDSQNIGSATTDCMTVTSVCNARKNFNVGNTLSPVGSITMFGGTIATVPSGWLLANGALRSKSTCAPLFNVIGAQFGCCGCCFNLPDLRATFARGAPCGVEPGTTGGTDCVTLTGPESGIQAHSHTVVNFMQFAQAGSNAFEGSCCTVTGTTGPTNATCAHTNVPAFLGLLYIIKN